MCAVRFTIRKVDEMNSREPALTGDETAAVLEAFLHGHGAATVEQMRPVVDWATRAKIDGEMLRMVIRGDLWLSHDERGVVFVLPEHSKNGEVR